MSPTPSTTALLGRPDGRHLADFGLLEEISRLTEANRRSPNPERERRLVALRNDAVKELPRSSGRRVWPPAFSDPFPGASLPELSPEDLSVQNLGGGVLHHGAVLVRDFLDAPDVARLVECIDRSLEGIEQDRRDPTAQNPWYSPFAGRPPMLGLGDAWGRMTDSPRAMFQYIEIMSDVGRGVITDYLGERPVMDSHKWTLRRIPPDSGGQWHQDGRFLGDDIRVLNVWIALTRCGGTEPAAGLELVPKRLELLPGGTEGAFFDWSIGEPIIDRVSGGEILDPTYEAGDALIFDHRTAHRTGARPGLTQPRHAIEAWFFAPSTHHDPERSFVF